MIETSYDRLSLGIEATDLLSR